MYMVECCTVHLKQMEGKVLKTISMSFLWVAEETSTFKLVQTSYDVQVHMKY